MEMAAERFSKYNDQSENKEATLPTMDPPDVESIIQRSSNLIKRYKEELAQFNFLDSFAMHETPQNRHGSVSMNHVASIMGSQAPTMHQELMKQPQEMIRASLMRSQESTIYEHGSMTTKRSRTMDQDASLMQTHGTMPQKRPRLMKPNASSMRSKESTLQPLERMMHQPVPLMAPQPFFNPDHNRWNYNDPCKQGEGRIEEPSQMHRIEGWHSDMSPENSSSDRSSSDESSSERSSPEHSLPDNDSYYLTQSPSESSDSASSTDSIPEPFDIANHNYMAEVGENSDYNHLYEESDCAFSPITGTFDERNQFKTTQNVRPTQVFPRFTFGNITSDEAQNVLDSFHVLSKQSRIRCENFVNRKMAMNPIRFVYNSSKCRVLKSVPETSEEQRQKSNFASRKSRFRKKHFIATLKFLKQALTKECMFNMQLLDEQNQLMTNMKKNMLADMNPAHIIRIIYVCNNLRKMSIIPATNEDD